VNDRIVDSVARGEQLFTEVKRYLVMSHVNRDVLVGMCAARVEKAWHAFILYTDEYARSTSDDMSGTHPRTPRPVRQNATQRVFNDSAGRMDVVRQGSLAELVDEHDEALLSANAVVYDALVFIARTGAFYVRELPGGLSDAEKVRVVEALLTVRALRLAP
jgi:hypothetical protein